MIVKITTDIFVDTDDAERAASTIDSGLESQMQGFPHGEVIHVDVQRAQEATNKELEEYGLVE